MAKTLEDLTVSRAQREAVKKLFGGIVPESILLHDKSDRATDLIVNERSYDDASLIMNQDEVHFKDAMFDAFSISGKTCRGKNGGLSRFPQNVGRTLLLLYTEANQVVFDPFAGHNSRMELCYKANRHYIGCDLSHDFMLANHKIRDMLLEETRMDLFPDMYTGSIHLIETDSRSIALEDESADFTITSPPYWDIEYYGDEEAQLGNNTYDGFLIEIQKVMRETFRILRADSFVVWCVNDFRKNGRFYTYHSDTMRLMQEVGFAMHDIAITDLGTSFRAAFAQQVVESKILPKRHEYCLIFKK